MSSKNLQGTLEIIEMSTIRQCMSSASLFTPSPSSVGSDHEKSYNVDDGAGLDYSLDEDGFVKIQPTTEPLNAPPKKTWTDTLKTVGATAGAWHGNECMQEQQVACFALRGCMFAKKLQWSQDQVSSIAKAVWKQCGGNMKQSRGNRAV